MNDGGSSQWNSPITGVLIGVLLSIIILSLVNTRLFKAIVNYAKGYRYKTQYTRDWRQMRAARLEQANNYSLKSCIGNWLYIIVPLIIALFAGNQYSKTLSPPRLIPIRPVTMNGAPAHCCKCSRVATRALEPVAARVNSQGSASIFLDAGGLYCDLHEPSVSEYYNGQIVLVDLAVFFVIFIAIAVIKSAAHP